MLADSLQGVVTQPLLPTADGAGRVAALEILLPDDAVRNLIRQGKVEQIYSDHADQHDARHADDGAVARRPRSCAASSTSTRRSRARAGPSQLIGLLERSGFPVGALPRSAAIAAQDSRSSGGLSVAGRLEMADESIWKKEISLGRKRRRAMTRLLRRNGRGATSLWKKEMSFGRKKKEEATRPSRSRRSRLSRARRGGGAAEEQTWTRAVSFGRKAPASTSR